MGRLLLIDVAGSVAVLGLWYFVFSAYNRKKGAVALRWVQTACAGKGRILESRWRQPDGSWWMTRDMFSSDQPPPTR